MKYHLVNLEENWCNRYDTAKEVEDAIARLSFDSLCDGKYLVIYGALRDIDLVQVKLKIPDK